MSYPPETLPILRQQFPAAVLNADYVVAKIGAEIRITKWAPALGAKPTPEEIEALAVTYRQTAETCETIRAAMASGFTTLLPGEQAMYQPLFLAVAAQFDARNIAGVRALLETAPAMTPALEEARATLLSMLPPV